MNNLFLLKNIPGIKFQKISENFSIPKIYFKGHLLNIGDFYFVGDFFIFSIDDLKEEMFNDNVENCFWVDEKNDLHTGLISNIDNLTKNDLEMQLILFYSMEEPLSKFEDFLNSIIKKKKRKNIFNTVL